MPGREELTPMQEQAVLLIAQGMRSTEVAKALGSSRATINRWRLLPQFRAELRSLLDDQRKALAFKAQSYSDGALKVLNRICQNQDAPLSVQVRAAQAILDHSHKSYESVELGELEEQIAELKEQAQEREP